MGHQQAHSQTPPLVQPSASSTQEFRFWVHITRANDEGFGISIESCPEIVKILKVKPGSAAARWNQAKPETPILAGDQIISVNQLQLPRNTTNELVNHIKESQALQLELRRAATPAQECGSDG